MPARHPFWRGPVLALGALCMIGSFTFGIESAGDMHTITASQAAERLAGDGDIDGDGKTTERDALEILLLLRDGREPTVAQLAEDPSGDGRLTIDDAILLLRDAQAR